MGQYGPSGGVGGNPSSGFVTAGINVMRVFANTFDSGRYVTGIMWFNGPTINTFGNPATGTPYPDINFASDEYITEILGKCGVYLDSISINTNKTTQGSFQQPYGPFGGPGGTITYTYQASPGEQIIGLFGRSGSWINAIGVYTQQLP